MASIKKTTNYGQFQTMTGNRVVDHNHVEKLRRAMVANPDWFATKPAIVNEHGFIIDGQHRWKAAQLAGLPFYYIEAEGMELTAAREMNIRQKSWSLQDYAQSYADSGRKSYQTILRLKEKHPRLSLGTMIVACTGIADYTLTGEFKAGTFEIDDVELATERVEMLSRIAEKTDRHISVPFARVFVSVLTHDDFDVDRFFEKLDAKPDMLVIAGLSRDNYRTIEDVYNFNAKNSVRLY